MYLDELSFSVMKSKTEFYMSKKLMAWRVIGRLIFVNVVMKDCLKTLVCEYNVLMKAQSKHIYSIKIIVFLHLNQIKFNFCIRKNKF